MDLVEELRHFLHFVDDNDRAATAWSPCEREAFFAQKRGVIGQPPVLLGEEQVVGPGAGKPLS